jgi:uncharacterized protein (UPF0332 family)
MTDDNRIANAAAEVRKAERALAAADALVEVGLLDDAMSRLYYAGFHMASAALLALGIEVKSHAGLSALFAQHLVKAGLVATSASRQLARLFALRQQADYNRHFEMDIAGAREEREVAGQLVDMLRSFLAGRGVGGTEP